MQLNRLFFVLFFFFSVNLNAQKRLKTYYGFDWRETKLVLLDSTYEFRYDNLVSRGSYKVINSSIFFSDSLSSAGCLKPNVDWSFDDKIEKGKMKIAILFSSRNSIILTSFYSGNLEQQIVNDSFCILKENTESFYFKFLGLDDKTCTIFKTDTLKNVCKVSLPIDLNNSIRIGNNQSYLLNNNKKVNFFHFRNGHIVNKKLYRSKMALIRSHIKDIIYFLKTGMGADY